MEMIERYQGCLLGLAVGDALGTTLEFKPRGTFEPIDDMVGGGCFDLEPGQWTDDTSLALCLAESLIEKKGFDPYDQMKKYLLWYRTGYLSSTGYAFDIGGTTKAALNSFEKTGEPFSGPTDPPQLRQRLAHAPGAGAHVLLPGQGGNDFLCRRELPHYPRLPGVHRRLPPLRINPFQRLLRDGQGACSL